MNFSENWKSIFSISSVFLPPLLLHAHTAKPLGPLFFIPSPNPPLPLFSSPSLLPPNPPISTNNLHLLKLPNTSNFLLFFPSGENFDQIGFLKLSVKASRLESSELFVASKCFSHRIVRISVSSVIDFTSGESVMCVGYLLVCTLYAVHWYRIEITDRGTDSERPDLAYLGSKQFNHLVVHACWNPHLVEESLVLLENGELWLFDLSNCSRVEKFPFKLRGSRIRFSSEDVDTESEWFGFEFSWHPRIFIVSSSSVVLQVDWRDEKESKVSSLAKLELFILNHSVGNDQFIAFCKAGTDGFYFCVASEKHLFLLDIRNPLSPLLQWTHGLDNPRYISVFKLSELRSTREEDKYKWASDTGFVILLGSFLSGEFNLFCYGPPLPVPYKSVASKIFNFSNSFYAWELPSKFDLFGTKCFCGDCLLRESFSSAKLPESRKERVLGFCIISENLFSTLPESEGFCGFTLIRLVSSGKLESQKYHASWDFCSQKLKILRKQVTLQVDDSFPSWCGDRSYKFTKRFRYLNLDYLLGYMSGDLSKVVFLKIQNIQMGPNKTMSCSHDRCNLIHDMLKAGDVDDIGSPPEIVKVVNTISWPMSILEVTSSRIWAGLPLDLLRLAFTTCSEGLNVLVEGRKISLDFTKIPDVPQMPPFFQKKPLNQSYRTHKKQLANVLVGPLLPLPLLLTLREGGIKTCTVSEGEENSFSAEAELTNQCNVVLGAAKDMASAESCPGLDDTCTISLAHHGDEKWVGSREPRSLFFYKPSTFSRKNNLNMGVLQENLVYEDEKVDTFVSRRHEKAFASNPMKEPVGLEMLSELTPLELNFSFPSMNLGITEVKNYKLLMKHLSHFQKSSKLYQDFCTTSKMQATEKGAPSAT